MLWEQHPRLYEQDYCMHGPPFTLPDIWCGTVCLVAWRMDGYISPQFFCRMLQEYEKSWREREREPVLILSSISLNLIWTSFRRIESWICILTSSQSLDSSYSTNTEHDGGYRNTHSYKIIKFCLNAPKRSWGLGVWTIHMNNKLAHCLLCLGCI